MYNNPVYDIREMHQFPPVLLRAVINSGLHVNPPPSPLPPPPSPLPPPPSPPPSPVCREDYNRLYGFVTDKNIRVKNSKGKVQLLPYSGRKMTVLGVLCCVALPCLFNLACFFLPSFCISHMYSVIFLDFFPVRSALDYLAVYILSCLYLLHSFEFQFHYGRL